MIWISVADRLPEAGTQVLAWYGRSSRFFGLAMRDEEGNWASHAAGDEPPTHWIPLPNPPDKISDTLSELGITGDVINGRLMLDIDQQKENVATLMQHYINSQPALINGKKYFVIDIRNEMDGEHMVSVFYLKDDEG